MLGAGFVYVHEKPKSNLIARTSFLESSVMVDPTKYLNPREQGSLTTCLS